MALFNKATRRAALTAVAALSVSVAVAGFARAADNIDGKVVDVASAGGMDELVAKAKAEGALLVYGAPAADKMAAWFSGFEDKYGIPVQYYRGPTNQVYQRFSQERTAGVSMADTMIVSVLDVIMDAKSRDWLAEYTPANASHLSADATIPGYAFPAYLTLQAIAWNTELVPEDLQEKLRDDPLEALLDPRLKNKMAVVKVTAGGTQLAAAANIALHQADKYGWDYLQKLADQNPDVMNTSPAVLPAVIAGDYWVTPDGYESIFAPAAIKDAPIAFSFPAETAGSAFYLATSAEAAHPYAARLLMEWMTSSEAQSRLAELSQATITLDSWQDDREITKKPWFKKPQKIWYGATSDPRLTGDKLTEFYEHWSDIFER